MNSAFVDLLDSVLCARSLGKATSSTALSILRGHSVCVGEWTDGFERIEVSYGHPEDFLALSLVFNSPPVALTWKQIENS